MEEVRSVPWNGLRVASTFSGAGGSSLGYRIAGFRVVWANEFVPAARAVYLANASPDTVVDPRDIRKIRPEEILEATGLKAGELDLLDGSPPCASFSTAGRREAGWGKIKKYSDTAQRTDDLFFEFVRLLRGLRPRAFVAENVPGLVKGTAKGYFLEILRELSQGYLVECRVLDAQWLGVPQSRQRTIFIGVRSDLGRAPAYPKPLPYRYSLADAIPWIRSNDKRAIVEPETDISRFAIGREWDRLRPGETSRRYFNLVRAHPDLPSPTILAQHGNTSTAGVTHPFEKRKFSIAELRRICGFPDDFVLLGTFAQRWERLGRSVPPPMMARIAEVIRDRVLS